MFRWLVSLCGALDPQVAETLDLAQRAFFDARFEDALRSLDAAPAGLDNDGQARVNEYRGFVLEALGRPKDAVVAYGTALVRSSSTAESAQRARGYVSDLFQCTRAVLSRGASLESIQATLPRCPVPNPDKARLRFLELDPRAEVLLNGVPLGRGQVHHLVEPGSKRLDVQVDGERVGSVVVRLEAARTATVAFLSIPESRLERFQQRAPLRYVLGSVTLLTGAAAIHQLLASHAHARQRDELHAALAGIADAQEYDKRRQEGQAENDAAVVSTLLASAFGVLSAAGLTWLTIELWDAEPLDAADIRVETSH